MEYSQQSNNRNNNELKKYTPFLVIGIIVLLLIVFWSRITVTIPAGHGGVLFRLFGGGVDTERTYEEGFRQNRLYRSAGLSSEAGNCCCRRCPRRLLDHSRKAQE